MLRKETIFYRKYAKTLFGQGLASSLSDLCPLLRKIPDFAGILVERHQIVLLFSVFRQKIRLGQMILSLRRPQPDKLLVEYRQCRINVSTEAGSQPFLGSADFFC